MKVDNFPLPFKHQGKTYKANCTFFKPLKELMYRVSVESPSVKDEIVFIFYEDTLSKEKFRYYKFNDSNKDTMAASVLNALQKIT